MNFLCPQSGIYWFMYTVVLPGKTKANITMLGTNRTLPPQTVRQHENFPDDDVLSSSSILNLTRGQNLSMISEYPTKGTTETGSSWGAFVIDSLMSPLVLFEVAGLNSLSKCSYEIINFNMGNGWVNKENKFIANTEGVYYFSATIVVDIRQNIQAYFAVNNANFCTLVFFATKNTYHEYNYIDTVSRGCLLYLQKNDKVAIIFNEIKNDAVKETYFRGFLYAPRHGIKISWSLHNNQTNVYSSQNTPIEFKKILFKPNNASWNSHKKILTIATPGVYFLEIVGSSNNYSTRGWKNSIDMCLSLNSYDYLSILKFTWDAKGVTRSRSVIAHLGKGDKVSVISLGKKTVYMSGHNNQGISFQGFLLYPDS